MVETNEGKQKAIVSQDARFDQKDLNLLLYDVIPEGIYGGFTPSVKDVNTAEFTSGDFMIKDSGGDKEIQKISTSEKVQISADHTSPFFIARKDIKNKTDNYAEFTVSASPNDEDVILASGIFNSNNDLTGFGTDVKLGEREEVDLLNRFLDEFTTQVSANDNTLGFLEEKLEAGSAVTFSIVDEGGDEKLRINNQQTTASGTLVRISDNDTTAGFLSEKVSSDDEITLTVQNEGGDETLKIGTDGKRLRVSSDDQNSDFLINKLSAGTGIELNEKDGGGDESLEIKNTRAPSIVDATYFDSPVQLGSKSNGNSQTSQLDVTNNNNFNNDAKAVLVRGFCQSKDDNTNHRVRVKQPSHSNWKELCRVDTTMGQVTDYGDSGIMWFGLEDGKMDWNISLQGNQSETQGFIQVYAEIV